MAKNDYDYFDAFHRQVSLAYESAQKLGEIMNNFDPETLSELRKELHAIENRGDRELHELLEHLVREFITPLEREDILALARELDDVTDAVEDVVQQIFMYNITAIEPKSLEFVSIVEQCCFQLREVVSEFKSFRKSKTIQDSIIEVNRLEEVGDKLYISTMRELYVNKRDIYETVGWSAVYSSLERCCDECEETANLIENIIMKNS